MVKEFREFIAKGNVVDLAVAVIIGAAFALIVKAFVDDILMPILGIFGGKPSFDQYSLTINSAEIQWGAFLSAVVNFLIIGFALFIVVRMINRLQTMRQRAEEDADAVATEVELLTEIRDLLQQRA
jgi:large conductance mechanosensitive channel